MIKPIKMTAVTQKENSPIRSLKTYIEENKKFRIPAFQRGFKWGVTSSDNAVGDVQRLMSDLTNAFNHENPTDHFIQGITVCTPPGGITEIIDGQQRTTFFYLLLCYLANKGCAYATNAIGNFEIEYDSRIDSQEFLKGLKIPHQVDAEIKAFESKEKSKQDIFYFRKALKTIDDHYDADAKEFTKSVLERVLLIFTVVEPPQARRVFSMMNQGKAYMKATELIKAAFLSVASRDLQNNTIGDDSLEWEINEVRSRFAREWNQWEHWWRSEIVRLMFGYHDIEFLLRLFYINNPKKDVKWNWVLQTTGHAKEIEKFNIFKENFLSDSRSAKLNFQKLRKLQQQMEQLVSDVKSYNYLALILNMAHNDNKIDLINHYKDKNWETIKAGVPYFLLDPGAKIEDLNQNQEMIKVAADLLIQKLNAKYVYDKDVYDENGNAVSGAYEELCRVLLWMNVEEELNLSNESDNNRYFNFKIWDKGQRTLEHIFPKSEALKLDFMNVSNNQEYNYLTVHSAGNLVLLYQNENSEFGKKLPSEKKKIYFDFNHEFKSRHLMHSIMVFAKRNDWQEKEIIDNQKELIDRVIKLFFESSDKYELFKLTLKTVTHE